MGAECRRPKWLWLLVCVVGQLKTLAGVIRSRLFFMPGSGRLRHTGRFGRFDDWRSHIILAALSHGHFRRTVMLVLGIAHSSLKKSVGPHYEHVSAEQFARDVSKE